MQIQILKTLIGSHAHGLATPESDYDYRGVFVVPTSEILTLGYVYKATDWFEGKEDNTSYELGHFLMLALKCNPSILEVFKAPHIVISNVENDVLPEQNLIGLELKELFQYVWNPADAYNAFVGYGLNQRKKMLDNHLDRWNKYGVAYVRTLLNLISLLKTGTFSLRVPDTYLEPLRRIKNKELSVGQIIDLCDILTFEAKVELNKYEIGEKTQVPNPQKVNEFLLSVRRRFW